MMRRLERPKFFSDN